MSTRKLPKKPHKPHAPKKPPKAVFAKMILFDKEIVYGKNKLLLDIKLEDLLDQVSETDRTHLMLESDDKNIILTLYENDSLENPNYDEDKIKFREKLNEFQSELTDWKKEKDIRRKEIKEMISNETKPKRSNDFDEDTVIKIKIKNRDVK